MMEASAANVNAGTFTDLRPLATAGPGSGIGGGGVPPWFTVSSLRSDPRAPDNYLELRLDKTRILGADGLPFFVLRDAFGDVLHVSSVDARDLHIDTNSLAACVHSCCHLVSGRARVQDTSLWALSLFAVDSCGGVDLRGGNIALVTATTGTGTPGRIVPPVSNSNIYYYLQPPAGGGTGQQQPLLWSPVVWDAQPGPGPGPVPMLLLLPGSSTVALNPLLGPLFELHGWTSTVPDGVGLLRWKPCDDSVYRVELPGASPDVAAPYMSAQQQFVVTSSPAASGAPGVGATVYLETPPLAPGAPLRLQVTAMGSGRARQVSVRPDLISAYSARGVPGGFTSHSSTTSTSIGRLLLALLVPCIRMSAGTRDLRDLLRDVPDIEAQLNLGMLDLVRRAFEDGPDLLQALFDEALQQNSLTGPTAAGAARRSGIDRLRLAWHFSDLRVHLNLRGLTVRLKGAAAAATGSDSGGTHFVVDNIPLSLCLTNVRPRPWLWYKSEGLPAIGLIDAAAVGGSAWLSTDGSGAAAPEFSMRPASTATGGPANVAVQVSRDALSGRAYVVLTPLAGVCLSTSAGGVLELDTQPNARIGTPTGGMTLSVVARLITLGPDGAVAAGQDQTLFSMTTATNYASISASGPAPAAADFWLGVPAAVVRRLAGGSSSTFHLFSCVYDYQRMDVATYLDGEPVDGAPMTPAQVVAVKSADALLTQRHTIGARALSGGGGGAVDQQANAHISDVLLHAFPLCQGAIQELAKEYM